MIGKKFRATSAFALSLAALVMLASPADARRGGSFGSRGARTYSAPPTTSTAPRQTAPVQRSMTDQRVADQRAQTAGQQMQSPASRFGGLAKGLLGGLVVGGLLGMLFGNGFGALSGSGIFMALLQAALLAGLAYVVIGFLRRRSRPALAGAPGSASGFGQGISPFSANPASANPVSGIPFTGSPQAGLGQAKRSMPFAAASERDLTLTSDDKQSFERILTEVQDAFGSEDYGRLRACTTPEIMSYLAEELSQNATHGQRNEVTGTVLLEAEVAEAWSEDDGDYATIAMQYESIDIMRDRISGAIVKGDPTHPSRATELWTFFRDARNPWRLSAIQEA